MFLFQTLALAALLVPGDALAAPLLHSHNDYLRDAPLTEALAHGAQSVEVDLWFRGGRVVAAHTRLQRGSDFDALYVQPLAALAAQGSIHGDGEPFYLWLDLKEDDPALLEALRVSLIEEAPFGDAVTVVLTGDHDAKVALADGGPAWLQRDSNHWSPDDPAASAPWTFYALSWRRLVGRGASLDEARAALEPALSSAQATGRKVRLYGAPDTPEVWALQAELGVDFVGTDDVPALSAALSAALSSETGRSPGAR